MSLSSVSLIIVSTAAIHRNLLLMTGITKPEVESCLNKLWISYADLERTNSTAAVLHAGSTLTDPVSASISGIVSGYGPLHGGAIDLAYEAFRLIGTPENVVEENRFRRLL